MTGLIRTATPTDYAALRAMHARMGIDYAFPGLDSPLMAVKKVREVDGRITGALMLRMCAETLLLVNEGRPQDRMTALQELQAAVLPEAWALGLDEIHASVPAIGFDKRLLQLGWAKDRPGFALWSRRTL